ncbi:MAG: YhcH/YjgK/YiaL family protein [Alloprevotella sp.]|nr:YhcH/YjgK/YiaL family protein [Alloprevotella sp.]
MILAHISDAERYYAIHPQLKALFEYIRSNDLSKVEAGRIVLDGDLLYINVSDAELRTKEEQKLEVHRAYIDVHFPLSGEEMFGWRHINTLGDSDAPFDESDDFALYSAPATEYFTLSPGQFCIVFPEDAHAPIIGTGKLRKLIAKIRL